MVRCDMEVLVLLEGTDASTSMKLQGISNMLFLVFSLHGPHVATLSFCSLTLVLEYPSLKCFTLSVILRLYPFHSFQLAIPIPQVTLSTTTDSSECRPFASAHTATLPLS